MSAVRLVRRRSSRILLFLFVLSGLLWATSAAATVAEYLDLAGLVDRSDLIVRGHIVDQQLFEDPKRDTMTTITTVKVAHAFHGTVGETVVFQQWGGQVDGLVWQIPGDAEFEPYEDVVLFLVEGRGEYAGMHYLTALAQAKYTVFEHDDTTLDVRDLSTSALYNPDSRAVNPRGRETYTIDSFVAELEALVAGIKGGR